MISHLQLAQLSSDIYDESKNSQWDSYHCENGVVWALKRIGAVDCYIFRGSDSIEDWIVDLEALPIYVIGLGFVHSGFYEFMVGVAECVKILSNGRSICLGGHSLGGARPQMVAAILTKDGVKVSQVTTFGAPRIGFSKVCDSLSGVDCTVYVNGRDPVPQVPRIIPFWTHPGNIVALNEKPSSNEVLDIGWHSIDLYVKGVKKLILS